MSIKIRKKTIKGGKKSLFLDIYHEGERKYEFLKLYIWATPDTPEQKAENKEALKLANNIRAKRELEVVGNANGIIPDFKKKVDFFDYSENFLDKNKHKSTYRDCKSTVRHFKDYLGKDKIGIHVIDIQLIEGFRDYLFNDAGLKGATPFMYFARFKTIFKEMDKEGLLTVNHVDKVKNKRLPSTRKTILSVDEIQKLADTPFEYRDVKRAFLFSCNTGLDHDSISKLKWGDIVNDTIIRNRGKTGEETTIPLNKAAKKLIGERGKSDENIFLVYEVGYTATLLKKWAKAAGIDKNLTYHCARHSFAVNLLLHSTENVLTVSKMLSHSDLKHTQVYARIAQGMKEQAVHGLPEMNL